jgi:hypothetical protein
MNISKKFSFTVSSTLSYLIFGVLLYYLQRTGQKRAGSSGSIRQPCLVLAQPLIFPLCSGAGRSPCSPHIRGSSRRGKSILRMPCRKSPHQTNNASKADAGTISGTGFFIHRRNSPSIRSSRRIEGLSLFYRRSISAIAFGIDAPRGTDENFSSEKPLPSAIVVLIAASQPLWLFKARSTFSAAA